MNAQVDIREVVLKGERLTLRPWQRSDLQDFFEYASVEGVGEMAGWRHHISIDETRFVLEMFISSARSFAISAGGKVIGSLGIEKYEETDFEELKDLKGCELGFVLSKDYWGQGLMKEACELVIDYLFNEVGLDFVLCGHFMDNQQSARVQEKVGFKHYRYLDHEDRKGDVHPSEYTIIYKEDWRTTK